MTTYTESLGFLPTTTPNTPSRLFVHDSRAEFLDSLANLIGCNATFVLPDGLIPDIIRISISQNILFIGDAKNTEKPTNKNTRQRLQRYFNWLASYCDSKKGTGVFALCYGSISDSLGWESIIRTNIDLYNLKLLRLKTSIFTPKIIVSWAELKSSNVYF